MILIKRKFKNELVFFFIKMYQKYKKMNLNANEIKLLLELLLLLNTKEVIS